MTTTDSPLLQSAREVATARAALERLDVRLAELREKSRDLDGLQARLDSARERRAALLGTALLEGRTANTDTADKEVSAALKAVEKRADEAIAITRALASLEAQREEAQPALTELEHAYVERREEHSADIADARFRAEKFYASIVAARECLPQMPAKFRECLPKLELLESEHLQSPQAAIELATSQAAADLLKADELAALPSPSAPLSLGWVWKDGTVHQEPEPVSEPTRTYGPDVAGGVGLVLNA